MTACCLSTLRDWRDTEALRWPPGRGPRGRDPTGGPASTHPAQVTPHQAARLTAHASQSRLHTSVCAPPQKAHAGQTQPARAAPRSLGFLPHQPAALGPPSVASGHQLASTHCPPRHCSLRGAWEGLDTLGCSGTGCSLPRGWRPGEDWSPKGGSKGRLGGRGAPAPTPPSQSHCARLSEWWTRARMHTHFRWRAPGSHTLSVHPAAQVPHKRVYIVPPPWPPAHQRPAQLPHMVKLQSLHSGRQRQGRGHGVTFCSIRKRPHRPPCPAKGLGV